MSDNPLNGPKWHGVSVFHDWMSLGVQKRWSKSHATDASGLPKGSKRGAEGQSSLSFGWY